MDRIAIAVLVSTIGMAAILLYYVHWHLPRQFERKMRNSVKAFSKAIELRFPHQVGKTDKVVEYSLAMGRRFGMAGMRLTDLEMAVRLRDIGLCAIPYSFNNIPSTEWTEDQHKTFFEHPHISAAMLELVPSLKHLAPTVRDHHALYSERGENTALEASILKVATEYVWLEIETGKSGALATLRSLKGKDYSPEVVDAFLGVLNSSGAGQLLPEVAV